MSGSLRCSPRSSSTAGGCCAPRSRRLGGITPGRIAGTLASLQLVLNVEGYPVLSVDEPSDTVTLNVPLLREQFALTR